MLGFLTGRRPEFTCAVRSACGPVRRENQDHICVDTRRAVYCVCDGMGGGQGGAEASRIVCEAVGQAAGNAEDFADRIRLIDRAVKLANGEIRAFATRAGYWAMGTTAVVLAIDDEDDDETPQAAVGWVGDSRAYRFRDGALERLTRDHTIAGEFDRITHRGDAETGVDDRSRAYSHILTRAVGIDDAVKLDWHRLEVRAGDVYLVCSDGVHDMLPADGIAAALAAGGAAEDIAARLEAAVLAAGAGDNYTFAVVCVG